jgi:hypothetical protein
MYHGENPEGEWEMKRMTGIDEQIESLNGVKMTGGGQDPMPFTVKKALLNLIGMARGKKGAECITIMEMGLALKKAVGVWEFKDADNYEALLKRIIDDNQLGEQGQGYTAYIVGILAKKVKELESFKETK